jgi:hypothetical protein
MHVIQSLIAGALNIQKNKVDVKVGHWGQRLVNYHHFRRFSPIFSWFSEKMAIF